ncbi:hypothetical protein BV325_02535 [Pseudomonas syringae pv. actinidiae]|nr:hypothetical protein BV361_05172 [Pseudomonas syringae pv. actinidiae]OSR61016.1 hypothetical protein BV325_02535 [Pseudomonas syringae pv. actinidiae]
MVVMTVAVVMPVAVAEQQSAYDVDSQAYDGNQRCRSELDVSRLEQPNDGLNANSQRY